MFLFQCENLIYERLRESRKGEIRRIESTITTSHHFPRAFRTRGSNLELERRRCTVSRSSSRRNVILVYDSYHHDVVSALARVWYRDNCCVVVNIKCNTCEFYFFPSSHTRKNESFFLSQMLISSTCWWENNEFQEGLSSCM